MYYKDLETDKQVMQEHNKKQKEIAAKRASKTSKERK